ncbi:hypothetical protein ACFQ1L_27050 [Phytohabitans flavus]|uniref:Uncharacterized protein n=1 Tax=Phytohabitans flavus TaxID=1076124 RepID=A0A6F8XR80_9ACTN|nr:hypothetical protein [Phytohabitans flavus]BCB76251.1 hypothetical protein Pflav_026610 [Phytohabitans flavus]
MQAEQLSWEEIVNRVTIAANYREVTRSAGAWGMAFRRSIALHSSLERLKNKSTSWKGGAADAFRAHVGKLADAAEQNVLAHERVAVHIDACASHLERAIRAIPIPSWKFAEVRQKQVAFAQNGVLQEMGAGEFWNGLLDWMHRQTAGAPLGAAALQEAEDFFRMGEQRARAAYQKLCADYALEMAGMPRGTPVAVPGVKPGEGGRSRGNGAQPKTAAATNPATAPANPLTNPWPTPRRRPPLRRPRRCPTTPYRTFPAWTTRSCRPSSGPASTRWIRSIRSTPSIPGTRRAADRNSRAAGARSPASVAWAGPARCHRSATPSRRRRAWWRR